MQDQKEEKAPKIADPSFITNLNKHESKADRIMRVYRQRKRAQNQSLEALKADEAPTEQSQRELKEKSNSRQRITRHSTTSLDDPKIKSGV